MGARDSWGLHSETMCLSQPLIFQRYFGPSHPTDFAPFSPTQRLAAGRTAHCVSTLFSAPMDLILRGRHASVIHVFDAFVSARSELTAGDRKQPVHG